MPRHVRVSALTVSTAAVVLAVLAGAIESSKLARAASPSISIAPVGTYASGVPFDGDFGAAEIPAYDPQTRRVFVVNGQQRRLEVLDMRLCARCAPVLRRSPAVLSGRTTPPRSPMRPSSQADSRLDSA
jgi:hypothetical protein